MNIYNLTLNELETYFESINDKKFRAKQIFDWLYKKRVNSFDEMTNIKKEILDNLKKDFVMTKLDIVKKQEDKDVVKFLFKLKDNEYIEAVLLRQSYGNSLCISTQVGCNMGCLFCESGKLKKQRNLETSEMILQIMIAEHELNERISHVVLMGIGEPFDNYDNVMNFLNIANDNLAIGIGARHITLSTCGIVPKIKEFTKDGGQVNLAISLHAPNDELRSKIMPINKAYPLKELISAVKSYVEYTNRRITFEYVMLKDVNDSMKNALELSKLIKGINAYVNLIPYNSTSGEFTKSEKEQILKFYDILKKNNINVTIRKELGTNVDAACGQLRSKHKEDL